MMNMKIIGMYAAHPDKMENCNGVENVGSSPTMPTELCSLTLREMIGM